MGSTGRLDRLSLPMAIFLMTWLATISANHRCISLCAGLYENGVHMTWMWKEVNDKKCPGSLCRAAPNVFFLQTRRGGFRSSRYLLPPSSLSCLPGLHRPNETRILGQAENMTLPISEPQIRRGKIRRGTLGFFSLGSSTASLWLPFPNREGNCRFIACSPMRKSAAQFSIADWQAQKFKLLAGSSHSVAKTAGHLRSMSAISD